MATFRFSGRLFFNFFLAIWTPNRFFKNKYLPPYFLTLKHKTRSSPSPGPGSIDLALDDRFGQPRFTPSPIATWYLIRAMRIVPAFLRPCS